MTWNLKQNDIKFETRGTSVEKVTTFEGADLSCMTWLDNKTVILLSFLAE